MRILQIDKFLDSDLPEAGGVGRQVAVLTDGLQRAGHQVLRFGCVVGKPPGEMPEFVDYTALPDLAARIRGAVRIVHNSSAARKLERFLSANPADVAHVHNLYHHLTPSVLGVLRRRGVPAVMTVHDYRLMCPVKHFFRMGEVCTRCLPHRYWHCVLDNCAGSPWAGAAVAAETFIQRFFRRYLQNVQRVLCPSRFVYRALRRDGFPAGKLAVLANPVVFSGPPAEGPGADGRVLYLGRISPEKGPEMMLHLAGLMREVQVTILGDGPMMDDLRAEARRRRLDNVSLPGHVAHEQVGRYLAEAGAVVVPSRCFEVSPLAVLEGMLAGRVVVAPAHGPAGEWIQDGKNGRLFRPGDAGDMARVVAEVLANAPARAEMGRAAASRVRQRHECEAIVARLVEHYREAIRQCESP